MIRVRHLHKHFKVRPHFKGFWGQFRGLLTRRHSIVRAVDGISFDVERGELVGYLGPNGAGKSTTIKIMSGLLVPTSGEVDVNGLVPWRQRRKYVEEIGVVFGQRSTLWWDLPVVESLEMLQHIYHVPARRFRENLAQFEQLLELGPFLDTPVRSLSLGQRMRADLCAALLHDPKLLFLDEPTIGLDVVARERIRHFIRHVNRRRGTTVLLTTHDMADVQRLCERVLIIDHGHLLFDGGLDSLQERFGGRRRLVVDFAESYGDVSVEWAELVEHRGNRAVYTFARGSVTASELIGHLTERFRIQDLSVEEPDIEATVRRIYEDQLLG